MSTRPAEWISKAVRDAATADRWLAGLVTVLAFTPPLSLIGTTFGGLPSRAPDAGSVLLTLGMTVPIAVRTRWPAVCLAVTGLSFACYESLGYDATFGGLALVLALYSAGAHQRRFRIPLALGASAAYAVFYLVLRLRGSPERPIDAVVFYAALAAAAVIGGLVRGRRIAEAERRRLEADAAAAAERARLARELHDVVSHHVTAMVVQSGAAQVLAESPARVAEALGSIGESGREALRELRSLLGVLEATGERVPGRDSPSLRSVSDLVRRARIGGQPIEFAEEGERPELSAEAGLTAYRVVQEALTNAVKYATGRPTTVRIGNRPEEVDLEVTTEGSTPGIADGLSGGRGLDGLRDRVREVGGELTAGAGPDGRFRVHARIPARREP
ncbi:sensor histidine kinase [Amycolatopsis sp. cg13]|uniref:sensor histidine kinase n=1 Tax=Amycolatopsis sp. cg13 TaxID=3238807 RepID=UPI003523FC98